ncbi:hypothetical protein BS50DRAFT_578401 [Corynespora cassiicola Philippines]|uniref:CBF1-interacting co-repressor CIR N-terminal domain-containing protein n=1 Tax=Corynespora cassiicola Philippines TaxID=1448308 RepID=A0A2T2N811_CORCC|nr:hypothetical protein BS50DRAFT_578401 [Corynespora cassiicola Philippines]
MPLHLLGKKSWNVYNPDNIARVKADEAAAAAQEAAEEERMQEYDAARRAAILRGESPPPAPKEIPRQQEDRHRRSEGKDGYSQKRRRHGEDDTDRDIRLAASAAASKGDHAGDQRLLRLRGPANDAPLTDHAGHIDLFPVDHKEALKRERRSEVDKEKKKKEQALEDQYKMRLSSAAGKDGLGQPWYAAAADSEVQAVASAGASGYSGFESKDVWGNEDPLRQSRQQARLSAEDPLVVMKWGEEQTLQHEKEKKKWLKERNRELQALKTIQDGAGEEEQKRSRRRKRAEDDNDGHDRRPSKHHRRQRSRSPGRERREDNHRRDRERKQDYHRRDRERKEDHHRRDRERKEDHRRRDRESDDHHRRDRSKREDHHRRDGMHPGTKRH